MMDENGILFVLSGPSGVGKGTVRKELFEQEDDLAYSISMTTRERRAGEQDGVDYFYKTNQQFEQLIADNELLEYARFVNNYYGTPRRYVENTLAAGQDVFLEIEVQGAMQVKDNFPEGVFIFLFPPSLDELKSRITSRGTESQDAVLKRLQEARSEIDMMDAYDYVVVNDDVQKAVMKIQSIIQSEHCRRDRIAKQYKRLLEEVNYDA
ncbi:guanylate kinase [Lentibacillus halophilus]